MAATSFDLLPLLPSTSTATAPSSPAPTPDANSSLAQPCSDWPWVSMTTVIPVAYSLICASGVVANALAVCVLGHASATRRTAANTFMLNLCVSDLLFLLSLPLWAVYYSRGYHWPFGWLACKLCGGVLHLNLYASIFFITAMSADRYLAIVRPLRSQGARDPRRALLACVLVWLLACACTAPTLYLRQLHHLEELGVDACIIFYPSRLWQVTLVLMKVVLAFLLPLLVISCCYCSIGRHLMADTGLVRAHGSPSPPAGPTSKAHSVGSRLSSGTGASRPPEGRRLERVLWTVAAVVLAFFFCWFPFHCVTFLGLLKSEDWLQGCAVDWLVHTLTPLTLCLGFSSSAINPVLYCFIGNHFRGRLGSFYKGLCACLKARGEDQSQKRGSFSTRLSSFSRKLSDLKDLAIVESTNPT